MSNEPVAWGVPNTRITERQPFMMLLHSTEGCQYPGMLVPLYTHPVNDTALPRLLRIMGTFDLATGHASTMDEALDELESELRDVLGYYRAAKPDDTALLRQALEALEKSIDTVRNEYESDWRHGLPTREKQLAAMRELAERHEVTIFALRERLKGTE